MPDDGLPYAAEVILSMNNLQGDVVKASKKHRFIFIATQKTGSTSIEKALEPYVNRYYIRYLRYLHSYRKKKYGSIYYTKPNFKHMYARMARELVGASMWNSCFSFAFVRNPWDRALSLYKKHHYHQFESERFRAGKEVPLDVAFNEWMQKGANDLVREGLMSEFLEDDEGNVIVDFIGRFEMLGDDAKKAFQHMGLSNVDLPQLNQSPKYKRYRDVYTNESRDLVAKWSGKDIETYDYDF
jgi:hypothetical protein